MLQTHNLWLSRWALEQDYVSSNSSSTTYYLVELWLEFQLPLLQKDLLHNIMMRFKGIGAPLPTYTENTQNNLVGSKHSTIFTVTTAYYFVGHETSERSRKVYNITQ